MYIWGYFNCERAAIFLTFSWLKKKKKLDDSQRYSVHSLIWDEQTRPKYYTLFIIWERGKIVGHIGDC